MLNLASFFISILFVKITMINLNLNLMQNVHIVGGDIPTIETDLLKDELTKSPVKSKRKSRAKADPVNPVEQIDIVNFGKLKELGEHVPLIEANAQSLNKPFIAVIGCGKLETTSSLVAQAQAYAHSLRTEETVLAVIVFEGMNEYLESVTGNAKKHEVAFISRDRTVIHTSTLQQHGIPSILIQQALSKPFNASIAKHGKNRKGKRYLEQKSKGRVKNKKLNGAW